MNKELQNIADNLNEVVMNQLSDATGHEIVDALNWIASELKRMNDRQEGKS